MSVAGDAQEHRIERTVIAELAPELRTIEAGRCRPVEGHRTEQAAGNLRRPAVEHVHKEVVVCSRHYPGALGSKLQTLRAREAELIQLELYANGIQRRYHPCVRPGLARIADRRRSTRLQ